MRTSIHQIFWLLSLSLTVALAGCQTAKDPPQDQKASLLDQQLQLAVVSMDSGKPAKSLSILRQLLRKYPKEPRVHNVMGLTQLSLGNPKSATKFFTKAYRAEPSARHALNLATSLIESKRYPSALKVLKGVPKKFPDYPYMERIYHNLGYAYLQMKRPKTAQFWLNKALKINPSNFLSHLTLGEIALAKRDHKSAEQHFRAAHDHCPECFDPVFALSNLYRVQNRFPNAFALLSSYLKNTNLNPEDRRRALSLQAGLAAPKRTPRRVVKRR